MGEVTFDEVDMVLRDRGEKLERVRDEQERVIALENALTVRRAELTQAGVPGKNAEEREAWLRLTLRDDYAMLAGAQGALRSAKLNLELSDLAVKSVMWRLRLMEVAGAAPDLVEGGDND